MPSIETCIDSGAGILTLNDPENGNRLRPEILEQIFTTLENFISDNEVRVIIIRSSQEVFCLGMDLGKLLREQENEEKIESSIALYMRILYSIFSSKKPVICIVNGDVKAGGVGLVCACDIVLATPGSTFELSEVLFGLIPANVLPYVLSTRMPLQKARYLVLTAKHIQAEEAQTLGLVDEVFEPDQFNREAKKIIKQLFRSSPDALEHVKRFTSEIYGKELSEVREMAQDKLLELISNPKVLSGIQALENGDLPEWFGKFKPQQKIL